MLRPRLTLLSGFLGAGKTTLLGHLLRHAGGRRIGVLVNDLASVPIDASLLAPAVAVAGATMLELSNGCICCSRQGDWLEALAQLANRGDLDHLIVEGTGAAEPLPLVQALHRPSIGGRRLVDLCPLQSVVTVVDTPAWLEACEHALAVERRRMAALVQQRPLYELMIEQVECADLVVLNKQDRLPPEDSDRATAAIQALNPRASILRTTEGRVDPADLLDPQRFDPLGTPNGPQWRRELYRHAVPAGSELLRPSGIPTGLDPHAVWGLGSFVYRARRPFIGTRFHRLVQTGLPGLVRAKGFVWMAEQPDHCAVFSLAGGTTRLEWLGPWWRTLVRDGEAQLEDRPEMVRALWDEAVGDCRQEIVFIGTHLDEASFRQALDGCLATEDQISPRP